MVSHDEHCFDCHTGSSDPVEGQVLFSLSRLIMLPCTVLIAQQLTRCEWEGEETLITVLVRSAAGTTLASRLCSDTWIKRVAELCFCGLLDGTDVTSK